MKRKVTHTAPVKELTVEEVIGRADNAYTGERKRVRGGCYQSQQNTRSHEALTYKKAYTLR